MIVATGKYVSGCQARLLNGTGRGPYRVIAWCFLYFLETVGYRRCTGSEKISYRILLQGYPLQLKVQLNRYYGMRSICSGESTVEVVGRRRGANT